MAVARQIPGQPDGTATELAESLGLTQAVADRLLSIANSLVEGYAPAAPALVKREAKIRCAGWLAEHPSAGVRSETTGDIRTTYDTTALSALRHSGGMALLSPYKRRRGGAI